MPALQEGGELVRHQCERPELRLWDARFAPPTASVRATNCLSSSTVCSPDGAKRTPGQLINESKRARRAWSRPVRRSSKSEGGRRKPAILAIHNGGSRSALRADLRSKRVPGGPPHRGGRYRYLSEGLRRGAIDADADRERRAEKPWDRATQPIYGLLHVTSSSWVFPGFFLLVRIPTMWSAEVLSST